MTKPRLPRRTTQRVVLNEDEQRRFARNWINEKFSLGMMERSFGVSRKTLGRIAREMNLGPKVFTRLGGNYTGVRTIADWDNHSGFEDHPKADIDKKRTPVSWNV